MERDTRRWLDQFFNAEAEMFGESCWCPCADVYRGRDGWLVKFDLAGVRPEDVNVRVESNRLWITGVRRDFSVLDDQQAYSMEISYNRFQRSVELPISLENASLHTEHADGMLLVLIRDEGSTT